MDTKKRVALVAHDNMKRDLAEWVDWNWEKLLQHHLICTGTTGKMVARTLMDRRGNEHGRFDITLLKSGPLGGDQQLGAMIARRRRRSADFFLGSDAGTTARCGCEGIAASGYALQRADGDQPFLGRLPDFVAPVRRRLRSCCKGLQGLRGTNTERSRTKVTYLPGL